MFSLISISSLTSIGKTKNFHAKITGPNTNKFNWMQSCTQSSNYKSISSNNCAVKNKFTIRFYCSDTIKELNDRIKDITTEYRKTPFKEMENSKLNDIISKQQIAIETANKLIQQATTANQLVQHTSTDKMNEKNTSLIDYFKGKIGKICIAFLLGYLGFCIVWFILGTISLIISG